MLAVVVTFQKQLRRGTVAAGGHALHILADGGKKLSVLLGRAGFAVGAEAAALGKVDENTRKLLRAHGFVQRADTQSIDVLKLSVKKRFKLIGGDDALLHDQTADALIPVSVAAESASCAARFPARRGKGCAGFRVLGGVKDARAHADYSVGGVVFVKRDDRPADRGHADVKPNAVWNHISTSFYFKRDDAPQTRGVRALRY